MNTSYRGWQIFATRSGGFMIGSPITGELIYELFATKQDAKNAIDRI